MHDGDKSYVCYKVKERELLDHGLMSWIVSRVSLSMAERLLGPVRLVVSEPSAKELVDRAKAAPSLMFLWNAGAFSAEAVAIFSLLIGWSLGKSYMKIKMVMKDDD